MTHNFKLFEFILFLLHMLPSFTSQQQSGSVPTGRYRSFAADARHRLTAVLSNATVIF